MLFLGDTVQNYVLKWLYCRHYMYVVNKFAFLLPVHVRVCIQLQRKSTQEIPCIVIYFLPVSYFPVMYLLILYTPPPLKNLVPCDGRHLFPCYRSHQLLAGRFESIGSSPPAVNCWIAIVLADFVCADFLRFLPYFADFIFPRRLSLLLKRGQPSTGKSTVANRLMVAKYRQFCLKKNEKW